MTNTNYSLDRKIRYRQILSAVHMVYRLVNSTYNVQELSLRLTRLLCQFIKASSSSIYLLDPHKRKIHLVAIFNNKINILLEKKKANENIPSDAYSVVMGDTIFKKRVMGLPLVAEDNMGAIFVQRKSKESPFDDFDRAMLSVVVEQAVTAIKNLQLYEDQQKIILGNMRFIGKLLEKNNTLSSHTPVYSKIVKSLAQKMRMGQESIQCLYYASVLHDVGAMDVPYVILSKRSQLTPDEFKVIRDHPARSVELIKPVDFLKPVLPIILYHHEKFDGSGYPSGLKKEQIPLGARVMAVVDAFEAMIQGRPYKKTLTIDEAVGELRKNSGTQFDPKIVQSFCELAKLKKFRNYLRLIEK